MLREAYEIFTNKRQFYYHKWDIFPFQVAKKTHKQVESRTDNG